MAGLAFVVLILAMAGHSSATWCVCKDGSDEVLQKTLDYACGAGADCLPIRQNGACFNPDTKRAHCSFAVNSYFQKKGQATGSCDFSGTATVSTSDPSTTGCAYPTSGSSTTPVSTTPSTTTPTTPSTTTPTTPSTTRPTPPSIVTPTTPSTTTPTSPSTTTPTTPSTATTMGGGSPLVTTPSSGVLGGGGTGLGPSGVGIYTDESDGGFLLQKSFNNLSFLIALLFSGLEFLLC